GRGRLTDWHRSRLLLRGRGRARRLVSDEHDLALPGGRGRNGFELRPDLVLGRRRDSRGARRCKHSGSAEAFDRRGRRRLGGRDAGYETAFEETTFRVVRGSGDSGRESWLEGLDRLPQDPVRNRHEVTSKTTGASLRRPMFS